LQSEGVDVPAVVDVADENGFLLAGLAGDRAGASVVAAGFDVGVTLSGRSAMPD
jgi:hypothetical protein